VEQRTKKERDEVKKRSKDKKRCQHDTPVKPKRGMEVESTPKRLRVPEDLRIKKSFSLTSPADSGGRRGWLAEGKERSHTGRKNSVYRHMKMWGKQKKKGRSGLENMDL